MSWPPSWIFHPIPLQLLFCWIIFPVFIVVDFLYNCERDFFFLWNAGPSLLHRSALQHFDPDFLICSDCSSTTPLGWQKATPLRLQCVVARRLYEIEVRLHKSNRSAGPSSTRWECARRHVVERVSNVSSVTLLAGSYVEWADEVRFICIYLLHKDVANYKYPSQCFNSWIWHLRRNASV